MDPAVKKFLDATRPNSEEPSHVWPQVLKTHAARSGWIYSFLSAAGIILFLGLCIAVNHYLEDGIFDFVASLRLVMWGAIYGALIFGGLSLIAIPLSLPAYRKPIFFFFAIYISAVMHKYFWTSHTRLLDVAIICAAGAVATCLLIALVRFIDRRDSRREAERFRDS